MKFSLLNFCPNKFNMFYHQHRPIMFLFPATTKKQKQKQNKINKLGSSSFAWTRELYLYSTLGCREVVGITDLKSQQQKMLSVGLKDQGPLISKLCPYVNLSPKLAPNFGIRVFSLSNFFTNGFNSILIGLRNLYKRHING